MGEADTCLPVHGSIAVRGTSVLFPDRGSLVSCPDAGDTLAVLCAGISDTGKNRRISEKNLHGLFATTMKTVLQSRVHWDVI